MKKPFHPFLFSAYFVVALLGLNITQVRVNAGYRSLFVSLMISGVLWLLLKLLVRDWGKSAILTTLYLLLFFTYGHIYNLFKSISIQGMFIGRHRILIPLFVLIAILVTWLVLKKLRDARPVHLFLNILGIVVLLFPVIQISSHLLRTSTHRQLITQPVANSGGQMIQSDQIPPDIYYIILDGYARNDFLKRVIGFDNTPFLEALKQKGFFIAECSQSNYSQTSLSLASALNYNYLDALGGEFNSPNTDTSGVIQLLSNSLVRQQLENLGYSFVTFENSYYWLRIPDSDYYFAPSSSALRQGEAMLPVNAFEVMLIRESALSILTDSATVLSRVLKVDLDYPNKEHRDLILYTLDKLKSIPLEITSPKFVYAHLVSPHFPVVFDLNGDYVNLPSDAPQEVWAQAHAEQIEYLNQRILALVDEIIEISPSPPIIILQADHGNERADHTDRMAILNAYYLPNGGEKLLYDSITPVNTFRIIFNEYFGGQLPLLEDKSYYSEYKIPYEYETIPNTCQPSGG
jgi:hypothetical protein